MATIIQKKIFKNTSKEALYNLYINPKLHSLITDGQVEISDKVGSSFNAFGGYITGKNLMLVKDQLIVQSWRGSDWDNNDPDSVFMLTMEQKGADAILNMVHAGVPDDKEADLSKGWQDFYWKPWRQHLAGKAISRAEM